MMKKINEQQGIGVVAIIAIIAVLAIGGIVATQVMVNNQAEVEVTDEEQREEIMEARADAAQLLTQLQADINAGADIAASATLSQIADIRAELKEAYAGTSAELMAEFNQLDQHLADVQTQLSANATVTYEAIADSMAELEADIDAGARSAWDMVKQEAEEIEATTETTATSSMEAGGEVDADMDVDGSATMNTDGAEVDGSVSGSVDL
ncbi:hypothetical protein CL638_00240 [bacterium]|nr:hypothetical protein [bacterium]